MPSAAGSGEEAGARRRAGAGTSRNLQDLLDMGAYVINDEGRITEVNEQAEVLLCRPAGELLGKDAHDLLHRGSDGRALTRSRCPVLHAFLTGRTDQGGPVWHARGDGSLLPTTWLVTPCSTGAGGRGALTLFRESAAAAEGESAERGHALSEIDRLALLADVTTRLGATLDVDEILQRLTHLVVPLLADWVIVDLLTESGDVRRAVVAHHDGVQVVRREDLQGMMPPLPADSPEPLARALRGAASVVSGLRDRPDRPASGLESTQRALSRATGMHSFAVTPVRGLRTVLGALALGRSERPEPFEDMSLLQDIAFRAGMALQNARQFEGQRQVAETMQRHLLPSLPGLPRGELAVRYVPASGASQVGGDWYDAFSLPDGVTALAIGDVVGHDLEAAAGMAQVRNLLRAYAWSRQGPPSDVVGLLDEAVEHMTDTAMATLIFARLEGGEEDRLRLRWTNAGHPPPLLVTEKGEADFLDEAPDPVLCTGLRHRRCDFVRTLPPRATLLFYTDGLVESAGLAVDDGLSTLHAHAAALARRPLGEFCDLLLDRVLPGDCEDDVALLVLRTPGDPGG